MTETRRRILWRPPTADGYRAGRDRRGGWHVERDGDPLGTAPTGAAAAHLIAADRGRRRRAINRAAAPLGGFRRGD